MLAVFLQRILTRAKDSGVPVCVVLVMKEAGTDLAEQETAEHSCYQKFCMKARFHNCKGTDELECNQLVRFELRR
jgi:hypothetical protein